MVAGAVDIGKRSAATELSTVTFFYYNIANSLLSLVHVLKFYAA